VTNRSGVREASLQKKEVMAMTKDPVCGMNVDEKKAAGTAVYKGKTYYFCSAKCKETFEKAPAKYDKD
jgi:YHS domain-containing protein